MRVMSQSPDPLARMHTMTKRQGKSGTIDVKALLAEDEEFLRALVRTALQEVLEAEMTEALGREGGTGGGTGGVPVAPPLFAAPTSGAPPARPIPYPTPRPILWSAGLRNSPTTSAPENLRDVSGPVHFEGPKVCWLSAGGRRIRTFGPPLE